MGAKVRKIMRVASIWLTKNCATRAWQAKNMASSCCLCRFYGYLCGLVLYLARYFLCLRKKLSSPHSYALSHTYCSMKFFYCLFYWYFLVLSTMPCTDAVLALNGSSAAARYGSSTSSLSHHHHRNDTHNDLCSPFCVCSCCGQLITAPLKHSLGESLTVAIYDGQKPTVYYTQHWTSHYLNDIFRPPQVG